MRERVVLGMDPHQRSVTVEAMDAAEVVLGGARYATTVEGYRTMLAWARQYPQRVWAIATRWSDTHGTPDSSPYDQVWRQTGPVVVLPAHTGPISERLPDVLAEDLLIRGSDHPSHLDRWLRFATGASVSVRSAATSATIARRIPPPPRRARSAR